jgi:hypothetical protein
LAKALAVAEKPVFSAGGEGMFRLLEGVAILICILRFLLVLNEREDSLYGQCETSKRMRVPEELNSEKTLYLGLNVLTSHYR